MKFQRRLDHPSADSAVATGDAFEVGAIDDALASAFDKLVDGDLAQPMADAHFTGSDRHGDALADQAPRHRVAVRLQGR